MIIWGGSGSEVSSAFNNGSRYSPVANNWTPVTNAGAPAPRQEHTAIWTGSEMIIWGGFNLDSYFNDTFSYTPDAPFVITSAVLSGGNLILSFPTVAGLTYTLWRSDTLANGAWTNTGLPALTGTGATVTFTVPATTPARQFFRVQSGP